MEIRFSQAFLDRFTQEEQGKARAGMEEIIRAVLLNGLVNKQVIKNHIRAGYFDVDAVLEFTAYDPEIPGGKQTNIILLPAITALFARKIAPKWIRQELDDVIPQHPHMNDERGNGTFASPLLCARAQEDWEGIELLSYNPNINPNDTSGGIFYFSTGILRTHQDLDVPNPIQAPIPAQSNLLESIASAAVIPAGNKLHLGGINYLLTMTRLIGNGAILTEKTRLLLNNSMFSEVREYLRYVEKEVEQADPATCDLATFKHAYSLERLGPWFAQAQSDDTVRAHLIELREEMPKWMRENLAPAYAMLGAGEWVERSGATRDAGFAGRFA